MQSCQLTRHTGQRNRLNDSTKSEESNVGCTPFPGVALSTTAVACCLKVKSLPLGEI